MYKHMHVLVTEDQYAFLRGEADRTGLSMGKLVRRSIDFTYRPLERPRVRGWQFSLGAWHEPDVAARVGRRAGTR